MKNILSYIFFATFSISANGQDLSNNISIGSSKPSLDLHALKSWPWVNNPIISPNGKYVSYYIENQPAGGRTLFVAEINGGWQRELIGAGEAFFSANSTFFVFKIADTLFVMTVGTDNIIKIENISRIEFPKGDKGTWFGYKLKEEPNTLIIRNLLTGSELKYTDVGQYAFDNDGYTLILQNEATNSLQWVNLSNGGIRTVKNVYNAQIGRMTFDENGKQLIFVIRPTNTQIYSSNYIIGNSIWYYRIGMDSAVKIADNQSHGIDSGFVISSADPEFSINGCYITFKLIPRTVSRPPSKKKSAPVDIWHYKDGVLQSGQMNNSEYQRDFAASVSIAGGSIVRLEQLGERMLMSPSQSNADIALIVDREEAQWWKKDQEQATYIVFLKDGTRKLLKRGRARNVVVSPTGKYLIYFDGKQKRYINYELHTGIAWEISKRVAEPLDNEYLRDVPSQYYSTAVGVAGWLEKDTALLLYDNYDIWQVDPRGACLPINITNGYGRRKHIKFRIAYPSDITKNISEADTILLTAFDIQTKYNGFYHCYLGKSAIPERLIMGPFLFYREDSQIPNSDEFDSGVRPIKASDANVWVIKRQSSIEAPNYYSTTDFKTIKPITNIQPQEKYNWLTTELITWKQLDGTLSQGILYKPQDFDPQKKYPLIITYYETFSYRMYEYPRPYFTRARLDIAWYASHGYLVFTPDIHYSIASITGKVAGDAAVNSVVSAAKNLATRSYVDATRMGIYGHSFGGYETNYIITHTNIFAAACDAAGTSDVISGALGIVRICGTQSGNKQNVYEYGHGRIGASLWQRPDLYIKYSPIFKADKITTPLLIMHNKNDLFVDWGQGVEMFIALRRLEKKVWMLQYDGDGHILSGINSIDFSIRLNQFFDHYLKGVLPPKWMTQGISANLKGIETGLELDVSGAEP